MSKEEKLPSVSTEPEIGILYILDRKKLEEVEGLADFHEKVKNTILKLPIKMVEFGPESDVDKIAVWCQNLNNNADGLIIITHTGTSARQTAVAAQFKGPICTWFFPETDWWSMASAGSGIGAIRDATDFDDRIKWLPCYTLPEHKDTLRTLNKFCSCAHTLYALKKEKIGLIGSSYIEVMPASNWHPDVVQDRLGPMFTDISITELMRFQHDVKDTDVDNFITTLQNLGFNIDTDDNSMDGIRASIKVSLALEKLQKVYNLTGAAINCYGGADPEKYTGVLGNCGASPCLKGHATNSCIIGCESDVVLTAQQMIFKHLTGIVPTMVDPWKIDFEKKILFAATCSGPADLINGTVKTAANKTNVTIKRGSLMSLYSIGKLGVVFPKIEREKNKTIGMLMCRIWGRNLEKMIVCKGELLESSFDINIGRLALVLYLYDLEGFLKIGCVGNHYTVLPTKDLELDLDRLKTLAKWLDLDLTVL